MRHFFETSKEVVQFVNDMLRYSEAVLPSITIIPPGKSADCSATIVIIGLLEDIDEKQFKLSTITSWPNTPAG